MREREMETVTGRDKRRTVGFEEDGAGGGLIYRNVKQRLGSDTWRGRG